MKRNKIHVDKNLTSSEKQMFLWLSDNFEKNKEFYITQNDIGKGISINSVSVCVRMASLTKKGYLKKIRHLNTKGKCNSYVILK
jgi:predicted transcriptional regulator of viral defense system